MLNYSIANLDVTPFISVVPYDQLGYFAKIFGPWLNLGGQCCPVSPNPDDNKPKFNFKSLRSKNRRAKI